MAHLPLTPCSTGVAINLPNGATLPIPEILGIGMNYAAHAHEQGKGVPERPVIFTKAPFSAVLSGSPIIIPKVCQDRPQVDFEAELGVVIGPPSAKHPGPVRNVPLDRALDCVLGYVAANDVSARWWQKDGSGGQFHRGKSFDTFCPLSKTLTLASEIKDPQNLRLQTFVNGVKMQDANTSDMIFNIATLIHTISQGRTLLPGTLIVTGTPSGVGFARNPQVVLKHGDTVRVEVEGVGFTENPVIHES